MKMVPKDVEVAVHPVEAHLVDDSEHGVPHHPVPVAGGGAHHRAGDTVKVLQVGCELRGVPCGGHGRGGELLHRLGRVVVLPARDPCVIQLA